MSLATFEVRNSVNGILATNGAHLTLDAANAHDNTGNGVRVQSGSTITLVNRARIISTQNGRAGFLADNGVGATLVNPTITGNTVRDLQLTFGSRVDVQTLTFGTYTCDLTVLRGTSGIVCPHESGSVHESRASLTSEPCCGRFAHSVPEVEMNGLSRSLR